MACLKCGSPHQTPVKSVVLVIRVERQRELEVTALHCQQCGFLEISAPPESIAAQLSVTSSGDEGRPN
jgi:hypothetical protein